ncbi:L-dopachrome tautomerase-related protein [Gluconobacter thailandicus]|uniref:Gluconolactonase n=1 Tax=Gluconobacter thailandicus TaxID=257438 RepID=A0AAP9ETP6_GLUTH|nr:L-dopachrome tautomerase-related protein [Gluconobacter thailandicus]QEH96974.1 gluconolactonase [Gluconobacter thailandicus]
MYSKRIFRALFCIGSLSIFSPFSATAKDSIDKGFIPSGNVQVIARFPNVQASGIAILRDGRMIVGFPRSVHEHAGPRVGLYLKGKILPFPDASSQQQFVSPLGMTVDSKGTLWILDEGMLDGQGTIAGAQKLFEIDPASNRIVRIYTITAPALLPDSHLNDVRIDLTHGANGTAFITDTSTSNHPGIIVIDLATGAQRRILANAQVVSGEAGFVSMIDGILARHDSINPTLPRGGVDGIALSADEQTLFWQSVSSRKLYSAPTALLADPAVPENQIEAAVKYESETATADGMATGPDGSLYITDVERHGILKRSPSGDVSIIAHDPRLIEPDGIVYHDGALYCTIGQWARLPAFHNGKDMEEMPFIIVRIVPR